MQVSHEHVAPEVSAAVVAVATVAKEQQLPARGDDRGHPVSVRAALGGHLQLHSRLEVTLDADFHL